MDTEMPQSASATGHREFTFSSLYDWERYFEECFTGIRLLGELSLTRDELGELAYHIRNLLRRHGLTQGTCLLETRYARSFLVFLAHTAARNEERGFWEIVAREVGVLPGRFFDPKHHWGRLFVKLTEQLGLETFAEVESGHQYVTPIRLHGGIPAYSLPDFFVKVLLPAVERPQYTGLEVADLIEELLQRSAVQYSVDSPVRYFLEYGGEPAKKFFTDCLEMALAWKEQGRIPSARELGLPRYVVRMFQESVEGRLQTPQGKRLRAPYLHLEPYDPETFLRLELPFQPVDATQVYWRYTWKVYHLHRGKEHMLRDLPVQVQRRGGNFVTEAKECACPVGPGQIRVELLAEEPGGAAEVRGRWLFDLAVSPEERPLLAFREENGRPIRPGDELPADILWLIIPEHTQVDAQPQGHLLTEAFNLQGDWSGWKLEEWDLTHARVLLLRRVDTDAICYTISLQANQLEPRLHGEGRRDDVLVEAGEGPLFVGKPPQLWLPRLTGQTAEKEARSWKLQIRAEDGTRQRPFSAEASLAELDPQAEETGFNVSLAGLLGEETAGVYTLVVDGPRYFHTEFAFRIWPAFAVEDLAPYYLPGRGGAEPAVFHVQIPADHDLRPVDPTDVQVSITETPGRYRVEVPPWATRAELILAQTGPDGDEFRVAVTLPVARLRWILQLDGDSFETITPLELPIDKVLQSQRAYLHLIWDEAQVVPQGRLRLFDPTDVPPQILQEAAIPIPRHGNRVHFDLARFRDTLAAQKSTSNFEFVLSIGTGDQDTDVPVLRLHRKLDLTVALLEWTEEGKTILHWEAMHRLRNRRVRLWSAWRPWEPGQEHLIPDQIAPEHSGDAPGSGSYQLPAPLEPGPYWVALRTAPPWEPLHLPRLPTEDSLLVECDITSVQERLKAIEARLFAGEVTPFLAAFERACIFHLKGKTALRNREITKAMKTLNTGEPRHIAALHRWLQKVAPDRSVELQHQMYRSPLLARLFSGDYPAEIVEDYMAGFGETPIIDPESARLVLKHTSRPEWKDHALAILANSGQLNTQTVLEYLEEQLLTEATALDLLARQEDQTLVNLYQMPSEPLRDRLLSELAARTRSSRVLRPGIWVRTEAGWGQVQAICHKVTGHLLPFLILDAQGEPLEPALIQVTLKRERETLQAEVDLVDQVIQIQNVDGLIRCAKEGCPGFVALHQEEVVETHCRVAHGGLKPAFRPTHPRWRYRHQLCFSWDTQHDYA